MPDFNFGKYAVYIWPAYIITAVVFGGLIVDTLRRAGAWRKRAEESRRP
jgi:heme exporter protein D